MELFLDLVFVAALALTSQKLAADLTWTGAFETVLLLMAVWWVWSVTALTTDLYLAQHPPIYPMTISVMFGTMLMTAALSTAFGQDGAVFAGAYVAIHLARSLFLTPALRGREARRHAARFFFWFTVSAVPWLAGAATTGVSRGLLWAVALAVDYTAALLRYPTPGLGGVPRSQYRVAAEHLAERYQQFFTLALGDVILVTSLTYAGTGFAVDRTAAFVVGFATAVLLWQIYVQRAGALLQAAIESSQDPGRLLRSAPYTHLLMVAGVVASAAGAEAVIQHPTGKTGFGLVGVIFGGPVLFLIGRARFEYEVFSRVSRSRLVALLVLVLAAPVMMFVPPLGVAIAGSLVLSGVAVADIVRAHGRPPEPPSPAI
ncbi:low temperature requirement protein A [Micromonospora pisi]|uniref:low temperature requirement protein A n=1 Tax=Micromonospora pisi TaxID=589240 RepID=UPI001FE3E357|nr:low temperature requirement protein A [Micromonospora pisi]